MLATLSLVDRHMPLQEGGRPYIGIFDLSLQASIMI